MYQHLWVGSTPVSPGCSNLNALVDGKWINSCEMLKVLKLQCFKFKYSNIDSAVSVTSTTTSTVTSPIT